MKQLSAPVSVTRTIAAPVRSVFAALAEPRRHQELDGSGMLRGTDFAGRVVEVGEVFVMRMHHGPLGDYEMINHVVELEEDRRIAWEPESGSGHPDAGSDRARWGHRWAFELAAEGPSRTVVTHTWDCSRAAPDEDGEHWRAAMSETLSRLEALCASEQIADVLRTFFAAFTSGPDVVARLAGLREVLLPAAVVVKTCGGEPTVYDVEGFIAPRQALLTAGDLTEFCEWEVRGQTQVFGDVAQHFCVYAKSWVQNGNSVTGGGMKTIQLVRTGEGWRISAVAWDDERDGLSVGDPARLGEGHPARSPTQPGQAG